MSMSRRVAVLSCLILVMALGLAALGSTAEAQPGMAAPTTSTPPAPETRPAPAQPAATAPAPTPGDRAQPAGMPPATSEYPPLPPPASHAGSVPMQPRGMLAPGATPQPGVQPPPVRRYETYRGMAFAGDLVWFWATYRLAEANSDWAPLVGLGGYVLTVPFIHAVKGNSRSAWISGGVRAAALGLTLASALATIGCYDDDCAAAGLLATGLIGMGSIMIADWFVLSRKEIKQETPARTQGTQPGWTVLPQVQVGHESVHLGVGGSF